MALEGSDSPPAPAPLSNPALLPRAQRVLCLSPHSDDAAFSVVGTLAHWSTAGIDIEIITAFSQSSYRVRGTERCDLSFRKREDEAFTALFPVPPRLIWLDLPDAPLRPGHDTKTLRGGGSLTASDVNTVEILRARLRPRVTRTVALLAPLAIGDHIDHRLALLAAVNVARAAGAELWLYEDLPYAFEVSLPVLKQRISSIGHQHGLALEPRCVGDASLHALKLRALRCYPSQVTLETRRAVCAHAARIAISTGGERLWYVTAFSPDGGADGTGVNSSSR